MASKRYAAGIAGGAAAAVAAAALIMGSSGGTEIELTYEITQKNEYVTEMRIEAPDELSADIAELDLNGAEVDKTLLPDGKFESAPIVFSDLSNLEIKLYRLGEQVGTARFEDGALRGEIDK